MTDSPTDTSVTDVTSGEEVFAKDPMKDLDAELRETIIAQGRTTIMKLADSLSENNVARVFRMIETISEHHREMIASLGLGDDILRRNKKKATLLGPGVDPLSLYESGIGGGYENGETFGAQAIQQIGSALTGAVGSANEGRSINQLVNALAKAKEAELGSVIPHLEAKLQKALGVKEPTEPELPPGNGAGAPEAVSA